MADGNIFLFPKNMKSSVIFNEELYFWGYKAYFNRLHRQLKTQKETYSITSFYRCTFYPGFMGERNQRDAV